MLAIDCSLLPKQIRIDCGANSLATGWTIIGGGLQQQCRRIYFLKVDGFEIKDRDPVEYATSQLPLDHKTGSLVFLTSADLSTYIIKESAALPITVIATIGLGNALSAGDPVSCAKLGTINIVAVTKLTLSDTASIESLATITEAKSAALFAGGVVSTLTGSPATGTGTDCSCIVHGTGAQTLQYAGKHTEFGSILGQLVRDAVCEGVEQWRVANPDHPVFRGFEDES